MSATLDTTENARDLLPELAPATAPRAFASWDTGIGLFAGLALAAFGAISTIAPGAAAAEGDKCRTEVTMSCAALSVLGVTGFVTHSK